MKYKHIVKMKKVIYLSYDLGVNGDYPSLYQWLAGRKAKECGDSFCRFVYEFKTITTNETNDDTKQALMEIQRDIKETVNIKPGTRIYVCSDFFYNDKVKLTGAFIIGKRKQNPWQEYENEGDGLDSID